MVTTTCIKEKREHILLKFTEGCCFLECNIKYSASSSATFKKNLQPAASVYDDDGRSSFSEILV